jgi:hypothetical protein
MIRMSHLAALASCLAALTLSPLNAQEAAPAAGASPAPAAAPAAPPVEAAAPEAIPPVVDEQKSAEELLSEFEKMLG